MGTKKEKSGMLAGIVTATIFAVVSYVPTSKNGTFVGKFMELDGFKVDLTDYGPFFLATLLFIIGFVIGTALGSRGE